MNKVIIIIIIIFISISREFDFLSFGSKTAASMLMVLLKYLHPT